MKLRKRVVLVAAVGILIIGLAGSSALAQERPRSVVSVSLGAVGTMAIAFEYETAITPGISLYVAPALAFGGGTAAFAVRGGAKKYFGDTAPEKLWVGGFGTFVTAGVVGSSVSLFGAGADAGYKYFITDRFTIEGRLGLMFLSGGWGLGLTSGLNVGYAF